MTLELTPAEARVVVVLIERRIEELGPEIHHTDNREYRRNLERMREQLEAIRARLTAAAA